MKYSTPFNTLRLCIVSRVRITHVVLPRLRNTIFTDSALCLYVLHSPCTGRRPIERVCGDLTRDSPGVCNATCSIASSPTYRCLLFCSTISQNNFCRPLFLSSCMVSVKTLPVHSQSCPLSFRDLPRRLHVTVSMVPPTVSNCGNNRFVSVCIK